MHEPVFIDQVVNEHPLVVSGYAHFYLSGKIKQPPHALLTPIVESYERFSSRT